MPTKSLYDVALAFRKERPWKRITDQELFGVRFLDGDIGYCCIMGRSGKHFALALYMSDVGLQSFYFLNDPSLHSAILTDTELLFSQDCLMCSFEMKSDLENKDLLQVKKLGYTFSGRNAYPLFREYLPGHLPWYLDDVSKQYKLRIALLAGLAINEKLASSHGSESSEAAIKFRNDLGFSSEARPGNSIPLLVHGDNDSFEWGVHTLPSLAEIPVCPVALRINDELRAKRFSAIPAENSIVLQCHLLMMPVVIWQDENGGDSAPFFPYVLFGTETASYFMLPPIMGEGSYRSLPESVLDQFLSWIEDIGKPRAIQARDERTRLLLSVLCEQIKIPIDCTGDFTQFDEMAEDFVSSVAASDEEKALMRKESGLEDILIEAFGEMPQTLRPRRIDPTDIKVDVESSEDQEEVLRELAQLFSALQQGALPMMQLERRVEYSKKTKQAKLMFSKYAFIVSISIRKGCYRHVGISAGATLYDLHQAILKAFDFVDDHAHAFFMDNVPWSEAESFYADGIMEATAFTHEYLLGDILGIEADTIGKRFSYVFDFGDAWIFSCKVIHVRIESFKTAEVLLKKGRSPNQYSDSDD